MNSDDKVRLFFGVRVSMETLDSIRGAAGELRDALSESGTEVRWVQPASYHVTIKFLGWTRAAVVPAIRDAVTSELAGFSAFQFTCLGVGAFPSTSQARVLWAGIGPGADKLEALAQRVQTAMTPLGFAPEGREFHPHVTMGRCRAGADLSQVLNPLSERVFSKTSATSLVLYESKMNPGGSEYRAEAEWSFEPSSKPRQRQTEPVQPSDNDREIKADRPPESSPTEGASDGSKREEQEHGEGEQESH